MNRTLRSSLGLADWRGLYTAAILETDKSKLPDRVLQAEQAVMARQSEICYDDGAMDEKDALEDALYSLQAFMGALQNSALD